MDILQQVVSLVSQYFPYTAGILLPPVISLIVKDIPPENDSKRTIYTVVFCSLIAGLLNFDKLHSGNPQDFFTSAGLIFTEAHVVYKTYFANSSLQQKIVGNSNPPVVTPAVVNVSPEVVPTVTVDTTQDPLQNADLP